MTSDPIRLATRGSDLARRQAGEVASALEDRRYEVDLVAVETEGDRVTDAMISDLGTTGAFVRALDREVLDGRADAAVHSMKDVPTEVPDDLVVAAVPRRRNPGDVLVTPGGGTLEDLPGGSVVGTASLRRQAQVLARRPDLAVEPVRGNVDTRVEKLLAPALHREHERRTEAEEETPAEGSSGQPAFEQSVGEWFDSLSPLQQSAMERAPDTEYDALVMARVGLERTGLVHHVGTADLPTDEHVPATGQGALCVTARRDSEVADDLRDALEHVRSRVEVTTERVVLGELGGGCIAPIGVHALVQGEVVRTAVQVSSRDGTERVAETRDLDVEEYASEAREFAADLRERGAADLVEAARRED